MTARYANHWYAPVWQVRPLCTATFACHRPCPRGQIPNRSAHVKCTYLGISSAFSHSPLPPITFGTVRATREQRAPQLLHNLRVAAHDARLIVFTCVHTRIGSPGKTL